MSSCASLFKTSPELLREPEQEREGHCLRARRRDLDVERAVECPPERALDRPRERALGLPLERCFGVFVLAGGASAAPRP